MAAKQEAKVFLTLHGEQFRRGLAQARRDISAMGSHISQTFRLAAASAGAALAGLTALSLRNAAIQAKASALLDQAVRSTKGVAGLATAELKAMASQLQNLTTFGDEVIMRGQAILLSFTSISKAVFQDAMTAALNLSTALDQDLKASVVQLGKALNDPIVGITALKRVGVSFTDSQREQIRVLVESGNILAAQKLILKELGVEFGGAAARAATTFGGRLIQLKNIAGDVTELIGMQLAPAVTKWATAARDYLANNADKIAETFAKLYAAIGKAVGVVVDFAKAIYDHRETLIDLVKWLGLTAGAIYAASAAMAAFNAVSKANFLSLLIYAAAALLGYLGLLVHKSVGFHAAWIKAIAGVRFAWATLSMAVQSLWIDIRHLGAIFEAVQKTATTIVDNLIAVYISFGQFVKDTVSTIWEAITHPKDAGAILEGWIASIGPTIDTIKAQAVTGLADIWNGLGESFDREQVELGAKWRATIAEILRKRDLALANLKNPADTLPTGAAEEGAKAAAASLVTGTFRKGGPDPSNFTPVKDTALETLENSHARQMAAIEQFEEWKQQAGTATYEALAQEAAKVTKLEEISRFKVLRAFVQSAREMAASYIEGIGKRAAIDAAYNAAHAIAALARLDFRAAAQYGLAAGKFMLLAGGSAVAASIARGSHAIGGGSAGEESASSSSGRSGSSSASSPLSPINASSGAGGAAGNIYLSVNYSGTVVYGRDGLTEAFYAEILPLINQAIQTGQLRTRPA